MNKFNEFLSHPLRGGFGWGLSLYIRFKGRDAAKNRAIKKAERLHLASSENPYNRKRYRVFFLQNRYQVITRDDIQMRKHAREYGWHVNVTSLKPFCFYDTQSLPLTPSKRVGLKSAINNVTK